MDYKVILEALSPILQTLITAMITAILPFAVVYVRRWLLKVDATAKARLSAEEYYLARSITRALCQAAEQVYSENKGNEKKTWVLGRAEAVLAQYGLTLDMDMIDNLVESIVLEEFGKPIYHTLPAAVIPVDVNTDTTAAA